MPDFALKLPSALAARARDLRLLGGRVPALLVDPTPDPSRREPPPMLLWMHGRTVDRFLDPGRYLRLMRAGIGVCAIDLPGHGDRLDASRQHRHAMPGVIAEALGEIDAVCDEAVAAGGFDPRRLAIGGMSAGGMIALARLADPEATPRFAAAIVEAASGSWDPLEWGEPDPPGRAFFAARDPIRHAASWRPLPLLVLHNRFDEMVPLAAQRAFVEAISPRYRVDGGVDGASPGSLELVVFDRTGAPQEHAGFGRFAVEAKDRGIGFLAKHLQGR
jgi:dipeptidyl aminopeptidase/acylaminoacyl peptidase